MLTGTNLAALGRRHSVRRADRNNSWPARCRTVVCVLVLAVAAASCGASKHASTSPSLTSPSTPADPGSRRLAMQQRPVLGIVYYGSPSWKGTALTCAPHDDTLMQCVAQTLDSDRIVLVGSKSAGGNKYVLGPVVLDGSDILRAVALKENGGFQPYWEIDFRLTAEAARRFADATREATGKQIAIIVDGQVVSAPVVQAPIANGLGVITCACDEERAKALAAQLNGSA
jgi:preprotein translocase subunit SecD